MEKNRYVKYNKDKSKKNLKKRKPREENGSSPSNTTVNIVKPLVEYSDVSSEDLSGPEAGEIQSEAESCLSFSDEGELTNRSGRRGHYSSRGIIEDDYYIGRAMSPSRRSHRIDTTLIPNTPSPILSRRERKHSISSRSSRSSEIRRRKIEASPVPEFRQIISSPSFAVDYDSSDKKKRKKKEKKHKKDKKYRKKKKKSKHRSRSTSIDSTDDKSPGTPKRDLPAEGDPLSDWEAPDTSSRAEIKLDTDACSPVSNDSHIASPELDDKVKTPSPKSISKENTDSPHTPPLSHRNLSVEDLQNTEMYDKTSASPTLIENPTRERSASNVSLSPVRSSPFRNPSPDVLEIPYSHRSSMSPSRKRRIDKEMPHRRHKKEKERMKDRKGVSRSRSPMRRRMSRSPSWGRGHYSRSPSRPRLKKYRSRSPKNSRDRERSPRTPPR